MIGARPQLMATRCTTNGYSMQTIKKLFTDAHHDHFRLSGLFPHILNKSCKIVLDHDQSIKGIVLLALGVAAGAMGATVRGEVKLRMIVMIFKDGNYLALAWRQSCIAKGDSN